MPSGRKTHTFLFADLAGFSALTEAHGDEEAAELAADFADQVRDLLPEYGGTEVKRIGDAVMLRVETAAQAVRLGLRIVNDVGRSPGFPVVRVGMHTGPAVRRGDDWFGASVNLAGRVTALASGCEVLLTDATGREAGEIEGVTIRNRGEQRFKNISKPVRVYAALPEGERAASGWPIDPVCRMAVDPAHSAGQLVHDGSTYHFCSLECAARFASERGSFVTRRDGETRA